MIHKRALTGVTVAAIALAMVGCGTAQPAEPQTLRFGVVPTETLESTVQAWAAFTEIFEEDIGMKLEMFEATSVAPVVESTIAGDLDLVMLGPFAQVLARDNGAELETVGHVIDAPDDIENTSVGLTRSDSTATSLADLAGEDVCFVEPGSATGYLFPAGGLLDLGIDPETDLNALFVGDHVSAVDAMVEGECAAVFTFGGNEAFVRAPAEFTKFWEEDVPNPGFSISTNLDADTRKLVADTVLKMNGDLAEERGLCTDDNTVPGANGPLCRPVGASWGVLSADDSYWEALREVCQKTRAPACAG